MYSVNNKYNIFTKWSKALINNNGNNSILLFIVIVYTVAILISTTVIGVDNRDFNSKH